MKRKVRQILLIVGILLAGTGCLQSQSKVQAAQVNQVQNGFGTENGYTVYWENGQKVKNRFVTVGSETWYFDENGHMVTGYAKINGKSYYFRREGTERYGAMVRSRFMKLGNNTLYFQKQETQL